METRRTPEGNTDAGGRSAQEEAAAQKGTAAGCDKWGQATFVSSPDDRLGALDGIEDLLLAALEGDDQGGLHGVTRPGILDGAGHAVG